MRLRQNGWAKNFEGRVDPMVGVREDAGYRSSWAYSPLVVELEMLKEDIDVVGREGPAWGRWLLKKRGFYRRLDTEADQLESHYQLAATGHCDV